MPVIKPTSLTWRCRECGFLILNQPDKDAYRETAFKHQKENHILTENEREFFMNKYRSFYEIN